MSQWRLQQLWGTDVARAITDSDDQANDEHLQREIQTKRWKPSKKSFLLSIFFTRDVTVPTHLSKGSNLTISGHSSTYIIATKKDQSNLNKVNKIKVPRKRI